MNETKPPTPTGGQYPSLVGTAVCAGVFMAILAAFGLGFAVLASPLLALAGSSSTIASWTVVVGTAVSGLAGAVAATYTYGWACRGVMAGMSRLRRRKPLRAASVQWTALAGAALPLGLYLVDATAHDLRSAARYAGVLLVVGPVFALIVTRATTRPWRHGPLARRRA